MLQKKYKDSNGRPIGLVDKWHTKLGAQVGKGVVDVIMNPTLHIPVLVMACLWCKSNQPN